MSVRLSLCALLTVCAVGCGSGSASSPSAPTTTPDPAPAGSTTITIPGGASSQSTGAYVPNSPTVSVGTTVSFLNSDGVAHTTSANSSAWDSGNLAPGKRFNVTLQSPGRFTYHCQIHPNMTGTITVQ